MCSIASPVYMRKEGLKFPSTQDIIGKEKRRKDYYSIGSVLLSIALALQSITRYVSESEKTNACAMLCYLVVRSWVL